MKRINNATHNSDLVISFEPNLVDSAKMNEIKTICERNISAQYPYGMISGDKIEIMNNSTVSSIFHIDDVSTESSKSPRPVDFEKNRKSHWSLKEIFLQLLFAIAIIPLWIICIQYCFIFRKHDRVIEQTYVNPIDEDDEL